MDILNSLANSIPSAHAKISGSGRYYNISGLAQFFEHKEGVYIFTQVRGLPVEENPCGFFAYHIHEGQNCTGTYAQPFSDALGHYNPKNTDHPCHAGDLPPLLAAKNGAALGLTFTSKFKIDEVIGRAVIIHKNADDFTTQPSGNSDERIACGVIVPYMVYKVLL